jgi:enoyl-CoA hydratase
MSKELDVARDGVVTHLTLNRPDIANALGPVLAESMLDAVNTATRDGTRLLVIQGTGKSFCSGFDLSGFDELSDGDLVLRLLRIEILLQAVYHAPFPTLAMGHGRIFGAGADLFSACSQRIAAPGTQFRMPGLAFGIVLGTRRLMARIGQDAARNIQNETRTFDAEEAKRYNFASDIADQSEWSGIVDAAAQAAQVLKIEASAALFAVTAPDTRAVDMADLVKSASIPGLKKRIGQYRDDMRRAAGKT